MCTADINSHLGDHTPRQRAARRSFTLPAASHVVDLTHVLHPGFPVWPGESPVDITPLITFEADGCSVNRITASEHIGTHLDAPRHFWHGPSAEHLDPAGFFAPLAVIDIRDRARIDPDATLTVADLLAWESAHGPIPAGACVAMLSGWETRVDDPSAFINADAAGALHFPGISPAAASWLLEERDIVGVGVDTLSIDAGTAADFPTHRVLLPHGCWAVENLARLGEVPAAGATIIVGGPMHRGASGGQCRVFAVW